jgi:hypothetical protein
MARKKTAWLRGERVEVARAKKRKREGDRVEKRQAKLSGEVKTRFVDPATLREPKPEK